MFKIYQVSYVPEALSYLRDHDGDRTSSNIRKRIDAVNFLFDKHGDFLKKERSFASKLKLSQGLYDLRTIKENYNKNFIEAIKINPLNVRAYYHLFKSNLVDIYKV